MGKNLQLISEIGVKTKRVLIVEDEPVMRGVYKEIIDQIADCLQEKFSTTTTGIFEEAKKQIDQSVHKDEKFHIAILDIRIQNIHQEISDFGQQLGEYLRKVSPETKIVIITAISDNHAFYKIISAFEPEGFIIKSEMEYYSLKSDMSLILQNKIAYSKSIVAFLKSEAVNKLAIDDLDREILYQLSKGVVIRKMPNFVPLSLSGIERRKRRLVTLFNLKDSSVSTLVNHARSLHII